MTLAQRLQDELTSAMRTGDAVRRDTLRMVIAAVYAAGKDARRTLDDEQVVAILAREVKTRRESIEAYTAGGRPDLADRERRESEIITGFLPAQLGEEELRTMVRAAIAEVGATTGRDLGRVMALLAPRTRGRADGRLVSGMVAQELSRAQSAADARSTPAGEAS